MTTYYTRDHEWIRVEGEDAVMGITAYATEKLGDVVFVELPERGKTLGQGNPMAVVESVKAASDVYAPIDGEVTDINDEIVSDPSLVNADPEGNGWFAKIRAWKDEDLAKLMDKATYDAFCENL